MLKMEREGFSLPELLITVAILAIMVVMALPTHSTLLARAKSEVLNAQLLRAINLARSEAALRGKPVTLCKSQDHSSCNGDWRDGQVLFLDDKGNGTLNDKSHILFVFDAKAPGQLHWRSSLNRDFLQILPPGFGSAENGTFWYCAPAAKNPAWAIVLSEAGRVRLAYPDREGQINGLVC